MLPNSNDWRQLQININKVPYTKSEDGKSNKREQREQNKQTHIIRREGGLLTLAKGLGEGLQNPFKQQQVGVV